MTFSAHLRIALLGLATCLLTAQAHAIAITDVSVQNTAGAFVNPSAASIGQGKAKSSAINSLSGLFAGDPWTMLDKTNTPSHSFNGSNFLLTADTRKKSGDWGLAWGDSTLPPSMDFVLVLRDGKKWGAYLFEAGSIFSDSGSIDGLFDLSWMNKRGKTAKLRRAAIYGRIADTGGSAGSGGSGSTGSGAGPTGPGDGSTGSGAGPTGPGGGSTGSGTGPTGPGDGSTGSGAGPTGPGDGSTGSGAGPTGPGDGSTGSGTGSSGPGDGSTTPGGSPTIPDPTRVPTPGSFALMLLGLGLGLRQLSRSRA